MSCWRQLTSSVKNTLRCALESFSNKKLHMNERKSSWENFVRREQSIPRKFSLIMWFETSIFALLFSIEQLRYSWEISIVFRSPLIFSCVIFSAFNETKHIVKKKRFEHGKGKHHKWPESRLFRIHERSKVTRYRSIQTGYCASVGTLSSFPHSPPLHPPHCIFAPYVCPTCAHVIWIRARIPGVVSSSSPIMCKLYYFYPKYISPPCVAPRASRSTGQIAHVHRKSPPGMVSQRTPPFYSNIPRSALSFTWVFPFSRKSRIFALSPAPCRSSQFENHAKSWNWQS